jgi:hypothetical protein
MVDRMMVEMGPIQLGMGQNEYQSLRDYFVYGLDKLQERDIWEIIIVLCKLANWLKDEDMIETKGSMLLTWETIYVRINRTATENQPHL